MFKTFVSLFPDTPRRIIRVTWWYYFNYSQVGKHQYQIKRLHGYLEAMYVIQTL